MSPAGRKRNAWCIPLFVFYEEKTMLIYLQMIEDPADRERFCQLYEAHRNAMYWTAYRILRRKADAEDAVQEAFFVWPATWKKLGNRCVKKPGLWPL